MLIKKIFTFILIFVFGTSSIAFALPQGQSVESGSASFEQPDANTLNITAADRTVINFLSFNIGLQETVNFIQPNTNASVLSRVLGNLPSSILGNLYANGLLFLVNPNGIHFGPSANVNTKALVASTLDISTNNFINQRYIFEHDPQKAYSQILNKGTITADNVALLGSAVENKGIILARAGSASLSSGNKATVSFDQRGLIQVEINEKTSSQVLSLEDGKPLKDAVLNSGAIEAQNVVMSAKTASDIFEYAVNQAGIIRGTGLIEANGTIRIAADKDIKASGTIEAPQGNIKVESTEGSVNITSKGSLAAADTISLSAKGAVTSLGTLKTDKLIERGASFLFGGTSKIGLSSMLNDDNAVILNSGNFSGAYLDAVDIIINDNALINLLGNTTFQSDSDANGTGAFIMNAGSSIVGNGYDLILHASQPSNLRAILGVGNLTLRASKTGSNPTYTANSVLSANNAATITSSTLSMNHYDLIVNSIVNNGTLRDANYYVDATGGNDSNPGTWQGKTWKTIAKVNVAPLQPGDIVLFKSGETWREQLIPKSGNATGYITYGAYGTGNRPLLLGSKQENQLTDWTNEGGNIWSDNDASLNVDVGNIIFNNEASVGNKKQTRNSLTSQGDFFYEYTTKKLYLYSASNPASYYSNIECAILDPIIRAKEKDYIIFDNLDLRYASGIGLSMTTVTNIIIRNCDLSYIGGKDQAGNYDSRYGNAIQLWDAGTNILIEKCKIDNVYDAAITPQGSGVGIIRNFIARNNIISNSEYSFELWDSNAASTINGVYFENNTCINAGSGWSHWQRWGDDRNGFHLMFWQSTSTNSNLFFRNNIFSGATEGAVYFNDALDVPEYTIDYNDLYTTVKGKIDYTNYAGLSSWQTASKQDVHSISADPLLNPDYTLKSNSPCIGKGLAGVDMGAYPYQSTPTPIPPAPPAPVGETPPVVETPLPTPALLTFTGIGSWLSSSLWSTGVVPGVNDTVIVDGICTLMADVLGLNAVTINFGRSLDLAGYNIGTTTGITNNGTLSLLGNETITGSLTNSASSTVEYRGANSYSGLAAGNNYNNLNFKGTGTWALANALNVGGNLNIVSGTLNANGKAITLAGNLSNSGTFKPSNNIVTFDGMTSITGSRDLSFYNVAINNGKTLIAPISGNINVSGSWTNNGTFNNNSGTVTLNGTGLQQVKTGGVTSGFNTLTITNKSSSGVTLADALYTGTLNATGGVRKLSFATGPGIVHTIYTRFNVAGTSSNRLKLAPATAGKTWYLDAPSSTVRYVDVAYCSEAVGKIITATRSFNRGNNTNWLIYRY